MRYATPEDAERLAELDLVLFPDLCLNEGTIRRELRLPGINLVVGEPVVGYALTRNLGDLVDITRLAVIKEAQGMGLGRQLLQGVLEATEAAVMLTVRKNNIRARRLYQSVGFQIVGHLPQAWFMWLEPQVTPRIGDKNYGGEHL